MEGIFRDAGLSITNYDLLLNSWSNKTTGISFEATSSYSDTSLVARQSAIDHNKWLISDNGYIDITKPDTTKPSIVLIGKNKLTMKVGGKYTEFGARGLDERDGAFSATINGIVDVNTVGEYKLTYTAIDRAGNMSKKITRKVTVK